VLAGALLRIVNGVLVGQWLPRLTGIIMQLVVIAGLGIAWFIGVHSFAQVLTLGVILGVAGASFAIALPMVSYWYPPEHQGMALGLAGAGNSGTVLASLFVPALAASFGWNNVLGLAAFPLIAVFFVFVAFAKNRPQLSAAENACRLQPHPALARCVVADVLLQRQLRRLRRTFPRSCRSISISNTVCR
jgi:NNP family nitrate/nitrite transporter-like MFS transporter